MLNPQEFPRLMARFVLTAGLIGFALGIALSWHAEDGLGWALLRIAALGALFAWIARYVLLAGLKGWIQSRLDQLLREAEARRSKS